MRQRLQSNMKYLAPCRKAGNSLTKLAQAHKQIPSVWRLSNDATQVDCNTGVLKQLQDQLSTQCLGKIKLLQDLVHRCSLLGFTDTMRHEIRVWLQISHSVTWVMLEEFWWLKFEQEKTEQALSIIMKLCMRGFLIWVRKASSSALHTEWNK